VNLADKALTSAKAAQRTTAAREKISAAIAAPLDERESLVIDALESAVEALDALTELLLAARGEAEDRVEPRLGVGARVRHSMSGWTGVVAAISVEEHMGQGRLVTVDPVYAGGKTWKPITVTEAELEAEPSA
jgi:SpoU rRNA methylase family enzyme